MTTSPLRIGLCGFGTVGGGTFRLLQRNRAELQRRLGRELQVTLVGARSDRPDSPSLGDIPVTRDIFEVARSDRVDVLVELIGGTDAAFDLVMQAIGHGKHIVTANKALIAERGNDIFARAAEQGVMVAFEAAIAGGIPIVKAVREGLAANRIHGLAGIINGTSNFILTEMQAQGRDFAYMLKKAQERGYAEADPTFDIDGTDAAHKLTILSSLAFGTPLGFSAIYTEGISNITDDDLQLAAQLGYRIKHLGISRRGDNGVELRVHPTLVPDSVLLARVDGVMNAVLVEADASGQTLYYGAGAGAEPTASAVVADLADIARQMDAPPAARVPYLGFHGIAETETRWLPIEDISNAFYLRMDVADQAGVMARLSAILGDHGISIDTMIQQQSAADGPARICLVTSKVGEARMEQAIAALEGSADVTGSIARIRVADLADDR